MNAISNQVQLIGYLGTDPELKSFDDRQKASFRLATNESYKNDKGEWVTDTQWHNIVSWGKSGEIVHKVLKRGTQVAVTGKLCYRDYEDQDGNKKYITEVLMRDFMKISKDEKPF
jgi:single-strand DNA-binding protein